MDEHEDYARDRTIQYCDQHVTNLAPDSDPKELYTGYNRWSPNVKCSYIIRSQGDLSGENHQAPTFRIKDVHTGATYNPEVWDFDLHYIEFDDY
jgi:hypothetical protein